MGTFRCHALSKQNGFLPTLHGPARFQLLVANRPQGESQIVNLHHVCCTRDEQAESDRAESLH